MTVEGEMVVVLFLSSKIPFLIETGCLESVCFLHNSRIVKA
jgi:hypothetical protein